MSGFFYLHTAGYPVYGSQSSSILDGNELGLIQAGFDKFATPTGFASAILKVNAAGTGYDLSAATLTTLGVLGGLTGLSSSGTISFTGGTVTVSTQAPLDNSTKAATTAYTDLAVGVETTARGVAVAAEAATRLAADNAEATTRLANDNAEIALRIAGDATLAAAISTLSPAAPFIPLHTYTQYQQAQSTIDFQTYTHITATSSLATDPSLDPVNWVQLGGGSGVSSASYFIGQA